MLGRTLGSYRLEAHIGSGGMGVVYRGEHTLIGRQAAVKVLLPEYSTRTDLIRRFFNEAKAAASAQHPNIVEVYDFGRAPDGTAYLVMELLEGDTLWQRLRKATKLPERQALLIARQIAAALAAAHQAGVIHRDLKPGNIFLLDSDEPGGLRVKLMDFGVAKLMRDDSQAGEGLTTTGAIVGTPTFMSPEQCRGGGTPIDWRSDLYSLGCILFAMLAGRPPFVADGSGAVLAMHIYEPAPRLTAFRQVSAEVERLVDQLLSKRADERASEIREVANLLAEMAPTEEGRRRAASAPPITTAPTVMEDDAVTARRATPPPMGPLPNRYRITGDDPVGPPPSATAPAFVVPASAVPALRDKPAPIAFPRPATTLRSGTPPAASPAPTPVPATGPLAPTLRSGTPAPAPPGGGVAAAVAVTVPAAAAAPPAPPVIAGIQVVGKRSETPRGWPDGTPTARTTMPPRSLPRPVRRGGGARLLVTAVLGLAVVGGSVFAGFRLGVFGGGEEERASAPTPAPGPRAHEPAPRPVPPVPTVVKDFTPAPPPPVVEPEPEAATAEPPPPPPRTRKPRAKKSAQAPKTPAAAEGAGDNVIDPFR